MDKKLSGLVRPTPLISYTKTENLNKRPGLKPPTTVSHFFEKPLNDKLDYSEPQLPLNIHPQKTVQSTPAVVLDKYADGLSNWNDSPIKVKLCNPEVFQESKLKSPSLLPQLSLNCTDQCNKTFTLETPPHHLEIEKNIDITMSKPEEIQSDGTQDSQIEDRFPSHTSVFCVNLLQPHSEWISRG